MGTLWQPHPTQDQPAPPGGFEIDSRIGAAAPRAPAASMEDSRPQAILKFHRLSSLDYRVRHELPVKNPLKKSRKTVTLLAFHDLYKDSLKTNFQKKIFMYYKVIQLWKLCNFGTD